MPLLEREKKKEKQMVCRHFQTGIGAKRKKLRVNYFSRARWPLFVVVKLIQVAMSLMRGLPTFVVVLETTASFRCGRTQMGNEMSESGNGKILISTDERQEGQMRSKIRKCVNE